MSDVCLHVYMHHVIRVAYKHYGNDYVKKCFLLVICNQNILYYCISRQINLSFI